MYDQYGAHVGRKGILDAEALSHFDLARTAYGRLNPLSSYYTFITMFEFIPFLYKNRFSVCWPRVTTFLRALHEDNGATSPIGIAGFFWGSQYAVKLCHDIADAKTLNSGPLADAFFVAHPSSLTVPQDIAAVKRNLSIAIGDDDGVMPLKQVQVAEKILTAKQDVDTEVIIYPGAKHGFSIRASRSQPDAKETKQAEQAEKQAVAWFQRQFEAVKQNRIPAKR